MFWVDTEDNKEYYISSNQICNNVDKRNAMLDKKTESFFSQRSYDYLKLMSDGQKHGFYVISRFQPWRIHLPNFAS